LLRLRSGNHHREGRNYDDKSGNLFEQGHTSHSKHFLSYEQEEGASMRGQRA
jgi:hypothetical protein